jgi:hypothetical protein
MSEQIKYTCSNCGKEHEQWPALTYISPTNYDTPPALAGVPSIPSRCCCHQQPQRGPECNIHLNQYRW